jgi:hypothetical protein
MRSWCKDCHCANDRDRRARTPLLTADRLRELLTYDPDTGEFRRRVSRSGRLVGKLAGSINKERIVIYADGRQYEAGQLAHLYMTGDFVSEVDHRDVNPLNNRWENLRVAATHSHNLANTRVRVNNKLGVKGVRWMYGKFRARIKVDGRERNLGIFATITEASMAYEAAAVAAWGEFARAF